MTARQTVFSSTELVTLANFLGIDPDHSTYRHPTDRPPHLLDDTNQITELA